METAANRQTRKLANSQTLGFILSQFPRYDEAFILRELVELSKRGEGHGARGTIIFSLRPCKDKVIHEQAKALQPKTVYASFFFSFRVWGSSFFFLSRSPGKYLSALGWVVSRHWNRPVILLKSLVLFPKTVHFGRLAVERGVTHLHAFWATYPATSAVVIEKLTGIPYSLSGHAHDIYTENPALAEKIGGARFAVTCTQENKRYLEKKVSQLASWRVSGLTGKPANGQTGERANRQTRKPANPQTRKPANIFVNYHGVDMARFSPAAKSEQGPCRILAVGSLLPCKGLETLIESCGILKEAGFNFHCTVAGGGPLEGDLRDLIARHGLNEQVAITGYVSQEAVASLYKQAHLFVLPLVSKIHWGIPNVLIEALATKTPVISCNLPSLKELVEHGKSGWVIPENDPKALAEIVKQLWEDPALREKLAEAGYKRVAESFSLDVTGRRLREIFENGAGGESSWPVRGFAGSPVNPKTG